MTRFEIKLFNAIFIRLLLPFIAANAQTTIPDIPVLHTPLNTMMGVAEKPVFSWDGLPNADTYRLQIALDSTYATTVLDLDNITLPFYGDRKLNGGTYFFWRVNATNTAGTGEWSLTWWFKTTGVPAALETISSNSFSLDEAYPNPCVTQSKISFSLSSPGNVSCKIFDAAGRERAVLANGYVSAGRHYAEWNAALAEDGVYYARLTVAGLDGLSSSTQVKKIVRLR